MDRNRLFEEFKKATKARINLGNKGSALPTKEMLSFQLDHAMAKDAVLTELHTQNLESLLQEMGIETLFVQSKARTREEYLKRPDLGRSLNENSEKAIVNQKCKPELAIILADGLSSAAIQNHAVPFLQYFLPQIQDLNYNNIYIATQARVALADEIGQLLQAKASVILIGERPGLSSPNSMGIYLTFNPKIGTTDEKRNCISNIHSSGLSLNLAASKLHYLLRESFKRKLSGVNLKDEMGGKEIV